jgi:hypothetical protein
MPRCTHIIPFSIHNKVETSLTISRPLIRCQPILHYAIEMFTGHQLRTENIRNLINHPANFINIEWHTCLSMDQRLAWGIEARSVNNEVRVTTRRLCCADTDMTSTVEILFPHRQASWCTTFRCPQRWGRNTIRKGKWWGYDCLAGPLGLQPPSCYLPGLCSPRSRRIFVERE